MGVILQLCQILHGYIRERRVAGEVNKGGGVVPAKRGVVPAKRGVDLAGPYIYIF